jgi:hypothetical protein
MTGKISHMVFSLVTGAIIFFIVARSTNFFKVKFNLHSLSDPEIHGLLSIFVHPSHQNNTPQHMPSPPHITLSHHHTMITPHITPSHHHRTTPSHHTPHTTHHTITPHTTHHTITPHTTPNLLYVFLILFVFF